MRYLFLGPCRNKRDERQTGGIVVLFEDWLEQCRIADVDFEVIDTNKSNYQSVPMAFASILAQLWRKSADADVIMMHGTYKDYLFLGPVLERIARKRSIPYTLRKFAGNFDQMFNASAGWKRALLQRLVKNSAVSYWETRRLTQWAAGMSGNVRWFPNVRRDSKITRSDNDYGRRFVFISTVNKGKGIDVMTEAFRRLGEDYSLDIFGPLQDGYSADMLSPFYKGALRPDDIAGTLVKYDAVLLPTMWVTEGYPGIIIEGLAVGVPAIASNVGGIPEIITDGENGVTFGPVTAENLIAAIKRFESLDYQTLRANARKSFARFDTAMVTPEIIRQLQTL